MDSFKHLRRFLPWCTADNDWIIGFDSDELFEEEELRNFTSSYHVVGARVIGLPYHEYLLYMAKKYNGHLRGKKGYCHVAFKEQNDCMKACNELEQKWKIVKENFSLN